MHFAASPAAGLTEVAEATGSALIVLGSARFGLVRQFAIGSVAGQLLHTSPVPLALAPRGFAPSQDAGLRRVSCGYAATARVFIGSTSSRMLRHSPVPVLVVPREAEVSLEHTTEHTVPEGSATR